MARTTPDLARYHELGLRIAADQEERDTIRDQIKATFPTGESSVGDWRVAVTTYETRRLNRDLLVAELGNLTPFEDSVPGVRINVKPSPSAKLADFLG